jgi:hypothetical protein
VLQWAIRQLQRAARARHDAGAVLLLVLPLAVVVMRRSSNL